MCGHPPTILKEGSIQCFKQSQRGHAANNDPISCGGIQRVSLLTPCTFTNLESWQVLQHHCEEHDGRLAGSG